MNCICCFFSDCLLVVVGVASVATADPLELAANWSLSDHCARMGCCCCCCCCLVGLGCALLQLAANSQTWNLQRSVGASLSGRTTGAHSRTHAHTRARIRMRRRRRRRHASHSVWLNQPVTVWGSLTRASSGSSMHQRVKHRRRLPAPARCRCTALVASPAAAAAARRPPPPPPTSLTPPLFKIPTPLTSIQLIDQCICISVRAAHGKVPAAAASTATAAA